MNGEKLNVLGVFSGLDAILAAIKKLKERKAKHWQVFSPTPRPEIEEALAPRTSPVKFFTLLGGITGCVSGFALTIWTANDWPLMTSAKPITSIPPFIIIAFELTILLGALGTLMGLFVLARLPYVRFWETYDPRFSDDRFGILIENVPAKEADAMRNLLAEAGAEEVEVEST